MAKHYKEAPWWWYIVVLVGSFVLGLIVVTKENITLPVWAYVVSLLVGIFISPLVSSQPQRVDRGSDIVSEHPSLLSIRQRHCHQQLVQDVGRSHASWTTHW